jgi:hypothetical protein
VNPVFGSRAAAKGASTASGSANGAAANGGGQSTTVPRGGVLEGVSSLTATRPEIVVAAAFAGGLALAIVVRRLGR